MSNAGPGPQFTMHVVRPWRRRAAIGCAVALGLSVAAYVVLRPADELKVAGPAVAGSTETTTTSSTTVAPTTVDPDSACRAAFAAAIAAGTEVTKFATLAPCNEDQWLRMQEATPIPGATLAGLCNARYGLPASSCETADAERVAREAIATTTAQYDPPTTQYVPATSPQPAPTTRYVPPTTQYVPPTTQYEEIRPSNGCSQPGARVTTQWGELVCMRTTDCERLYWRPSAEYRSGPCIPQ